MARKITLAQKKRAVEIALNGGNPLPYLKQCGSERPDGLWYTIKQDLKKADPTAYERLPKRCGEKKQAEPAAEAPDDDDPKYYDPAYLASCGSEAKHRIDDKKIAEPIAEKAEEVVDNKEKAVYKPETVVENKVEAVEKPETAAEPESDPFIVTAVEGKFGEYHFDAENGFVGWKPMEGPIICMSAEKWHKFINEFMGAMNKLIQERASKKLAKQAE